jgi:hypothetical protein
MASINRESNGRRTIQFIGPDGKRRSIRLGKASQRLAEGFRVKVEALARAVALGQLLDDEVTSRSTTHYSTVRNGCVERTSGTSIVGTHSGYG